MSDLSRRRRSPRRPKVPARDAFARSTAIAAICLATTLGGGCGDASSGKPASPASVKDPVASNDKTASATAVSANGAMTGTAENAAPVARLVVTGEFSTPESALHDAASDIYLVGNIGGSPLEKDDNGFISRVTPTGEIAELKWIDGAKDSVELDAPKGLALLGNALVVADIDHVRFFDRVTGVPLQQVEIPGATFLNDVTPSLDGLAVYVTDSGMQMKDGEFGPSGTDAVYRVTAAGEIQELVKDPSLGGPNGIVERADGKLMLVNFRDGAIWTLDDVTAKPAPRTTVIAGDASPGQLDGIVALADGDFLVSSWGTSQVHRIHDGKLSVAVDGVTSPADIGFDVQRGVLLIPLFLENQFVIVPPRAAAMK